MTPEQMLELLLAHNVHGDVFSTKEQRWLLAMASEAVAWRDDYTEFELGDMKGPLGRAIENSDRLLAEMGGGA